MHYVERVGLDYVKQQVVDDAANRKALYERLLYALNGAKNPWAKENVNKREFEALSL